MIVTIFVVAGVPAKANEAARFHREALVMHKSRSYELALQHAETAFALEPENQKYKETLVRFLSDLAQSLLVREIAPEPYHRDTIIATPKGAAKSLALINRAFDYVEKDPKYFNVYQLGPDVSTRYFEAARLVPTDIYPEWKAESDKFLNRVITDWTEFRYPYRCNLVKDEKTFNSWQKYAQPPRYIRLFAPASVAATIYETYFRDLFAFRKEYSEFSLDDNYRYRKELYEWSQYPGIGFNAFARQYLSNTLMQQIRQQRHQDENDTPDNRLARQIVERTLATFSEQDSVFFDVFAWCQFQEVKLNHRLTEIPFPQPEVANGRYVDIEKMEKDFQDYYKSLNAILVANEKEIRDKINAIPKEAFLEDYYDLYYLLISSYNTLYMVRKHILFDYLHGQETPPLPTPPSQVDLLYDAFQIALDRGTILFDPVSHVVEYSSIGHGSTYIDRKLTPEEQRKMAEMCRRAVEAFDAGTASSTHRVQYETNRRNTLQRYYEMYVVQLNPEPLPTHAPWKEEIVLSEDEWIRYNVGPSSIEGETFCILLDKEDWENMERHGWRAGALVPMLINLKTLEKTELASWNYADKVHGNMSISSSETTDWQIFCGSKYVAVGSSYAGFSHGKKDFGIIVFPRDGTEAFAIDTDAGLPSNRVRGLGVLGDTLYAGVGDWNSATWLVKIDLPTRKIEILSSSRGKEGKAPFFDLERAPQFRHFTYDAKRERLLFHVSIGNRHPLDGLWTIDGKSEDIAQLSNRIELLRDGNRGEILADGDTYLAGGSGGYFLTDLRDGTVTPLTTFFSQCTVQQGWIWGLTPSAVKGESHFARIRNDRPTESEKLPYSGTGESTFLATPDGKGIIRCDDRNGKTVLIRL